MNFFEESNILGACEDPELAYLEQILPTKIRYYVEYVQSRTFMGDLRIILKTISAIFR